MKIVIIPLMIGVALVAPSRAQQKKSDLEHAGLKGKVKSIKIEQAKITTKSGKQVEGKRVQLETQTYNKDGMLVKSVRYDGDRRGDYFYDYDSSGNRLEFIRSAISSSRVKTAFKYDANGYRTEEVQDGDQGLVARVVSVYNTSGLRTERRMYNKQGLFARRTYTYGADSNPIEEAEFDPKGDLVGKQRYTYELDSTGNWIKRVTLSQGMSDGKPVSEPAEVTYRTITYF